MIKFCASQPVNIPFKIHAAVMLKMIPTRNKGEKQKFSLKYCYVHQTLLRYLVRMQVISMNGPSLSFCVRWPGPGLGIWELEHLGTVISAHRAFSTWNSLASAILQIISKFNSYSQHQHVLLVCTVTSRDKEVINGNYNTCTYNYD